MSSLTDIIFLLLIFFMLTSSLVIPNALNLKLPGKSQTKPSISKQPTNVAIKRDGKYYVNGKRVSLRQLEVAVRALKKQGGKPAITVTPDAKAPSDKVVGVLDIAFRYGVETVLLEP